MQDFLIFYKNPKNSDIKKNQYHRFYHPNADKMADSVNLDQIAPYGAVWFFTDDQFGSALTAALYMKTYQGREHCHHTSLISSTNCAKPIK